MSDTGGDTHNEVNAEFISVVVQARDIGSVTLQLPARVPEALSGLPVRSASFTGRDQVLEQLLECLAADGKSGAVVVAAAVGGMGGIGKTELAIQAARTALVRGWFPGGVLFADLRGYDPDPALRGDPGQALEGFLRALRVPGEHIPPSVEDRSRLLRSLLAAYAERGRRVLVVADNVSTSGQAAPLLPSDGVCTAIVTSRHTLARLGARLIDLDVLDPDPAVDLLDRALRTARPSDTRVSDSPEQALRIVQACGGLPLALQIVAALLATSPAKPLSAMADDLADQANRLTELTDDTHSITAAFDLSYHQLPNAQARLFRLLSLNPGPDVSTLAAAALTAVTETDARRSLEALARAHLIEPGAKYGRWRMHDLLRLHSAHHGATCATTDQRDQALTRLLDHYLTTTRAADAHLNREIADRASHKFPDRQQALAWLEIEYPNLTAVALTAEQAGHPTIARDLPHAMWYFMHWERHFNDWITLTHTALHAARSLDDRPAQARALHTLSVALQGARRFEDAITAAQQATELYRERGDRYREGLSLGALGVALNRAQRHEDAITAHQQTIQIYRELGDRSSEAGGLTNLGVALLGAQRYEDAITASQTAIQILYELGIRHMEAGALDTLGGALLGAQRFEDAITAHQQAIQIYRDLGDRYREAGGLTNLGAAFLGAQRFEDAITAHQTAARIFHELGDDYLETNARDDLQETLRARDAALNEPSD